MRKKTAKEKNHKEVRGRKDHYFLEKKFTFSRYKFNEEEI